MEEDPDRDLLNTKLACLFPFWEMAKAAVSSVLTNTDANGMHNTLETPACPCILSRTLHRDPCWHCFSSFPDQNLVSPTQPPLNFPFYFLWEAKSTCFWEDAEESGQAPTFCLLPCGDSTLRLLQLEKTFSPLFP